MYQTDLPDPSPEYPVHLFVKLRDKEFIICVDIQGVVLGIRQTVRRKGPYLVMKI